MRSLIFSLVFAALALIPAAAFGGELNPAAAPDATTSHTLENIYNRLDTGADGSESTFTEPDAVPGDTGTGHTLNQIMDKAPVIDDTDGATPADVAKDKTFWGLTSEKWGLQAGTYEEQETTPTCSGTMTGTRWCDNENGTVTDMTTGLVWLKNADWGGLKKWWDGSPNYDDAHARAGSLKDGATGANLSDDSVEGDWRLPTRSELYGLANGTYAVRLSAWQAFDGQYDIFKIYWSSTARSVRSTGAWVVHLSDGIGFYDGKTKGWFVWPVRGGQ